MSEKQVRKRWTGDEIVALIRRHLVEKVAGRTSSGRVTIAVEIVRAYPPSGYENFPDEGKRRTRHA